MSEHERKAWSWISTPIGVGIIPAFSYLGLIGHDWIRSLLVVTSANWLPPFPGPDDVSRIWGTVLAVHAAIAAIAPTLGVTLVTKQIDESRFPVPAASFVSEAVGWRRYLKITLIGLAGSVIGYAAAPSLPGLALATAAAAYTATATMRVYWVLFSLLQDDLAFNERMLNYLKGLVEKATAPAPLHPLLARDLASVNDILRGLNPARDAVGVLEHEPYETLSLSGEGDLVKADPMAFRELERMALARKVQLWPLEESVPDSLAGRLSSYALIRVRLLPEVTQEQEPPPPPNLVRLKKAARELKVVLDRAVQYSKTRRHLDQQKLAQHLRLRLARILHDSVDKQRRYELEDGLEYLGHVVDALAENGADGLDSWRSEFSWYVELPEGLIRRLRAQQPLDVGCAYAIAGFIRDRMRIWLGSANAGKYRSAIAQYSRLFEDLLVLAAERDTECAKAVAVRARWLAAESIDDDGKSSSIAYLTAWKLLARATLRAAESEESSTETVRILHRYLWQAVDGVAHRLAPAHQGDGQRLVTDFAVGFVGAVLLQHAEPTGQHSLLSRDRGRISLKVNERQFTLDVVLATVRDLDRVVAQWGWEMWEVTRSREEGARWIQIHLWCRRAAALLLAGQFWRLGGVAGEDLPELTVVDHLIEAIGRDAAQQGWMSVLEPHQKARLEGFLPELDSARTRRQEYQETLAADADLDRQKCQVWVQDAVEDIEGGLASHKAWLRGIGAEGVVPEVGADDDTHMVRKLVDRSCFVRDGELDQSPRLLPAPYGSGIVNHELRTIAAKLLEGREHQQIASVADDKLWRYVNELEPDPETNKAGLFLIDTGIRDYELWRLLDEKGIRQHVADERSGVRLVRAPSVPGLPAALIVGIGHKSFMVNRYLPTPPLEGSLAHAVADEGHTNVAVTLAEIPQAVVEKWSAAMTDKTPEELTKAQEFWRRSLRTEVAWSFRVDVLPDAEYRIFMLDPADKVGDDVNPAADA
jgi:hypothetical protein